MIHATPTFATYQQQPTTVTPPSSVDSWNSYQAYDQHYSTLLSPASSPYATFSHQYAPYENQMFATIRPYEYGSPSRTNGILVDTSDVHHKTDYSSIDGSDA